MGDAEYLAAFDELLLPVARELDPDLVLVSCGFDAAAGDLLGQMHVSPKGFGQMTQRLLDLAGGRLVLALEGGYNLDAIARSAASCVRVLQGENPASEQTQSPHPMARRTIGEARRIHSAYWRSL
jgi:acetoin utilization deacetylase AcuC-like enzyme